MLWISLIAVAALVAFAALATATRAQIQRTRDERRRRYSLKDTGERLPLAGPRAANEAGEQIREEAGLPPPARRAPTLLETLRQDEQPGAAPDGPPAPALSPSSEIGRIVDTPDGEMVLTNPPFALRAALLTNRTGRFLNRLSRRVPAWVMCCPKVRLESLLTPTAPDDRDAEDWSNWRRRVRWRSVDIVLVDRRTWRPLLGIVFRQQSTRPVARALAGGQDRMIDEVLAAVGLPMVRVSGVFEEDWRLIRPYIDEAILPSAGENDVRAGAEQVSPEAAINLLRLDEDKGWILG